ncbi:MAG TPA: SDR family oxidoreductase [Noviherbaspirillum sp.]|uniref:SDR family oxidoreductase n=1 Tax=Noviherbaspirillum sp. TaxID=1926288 RepID=UPI002B459397|nr:SDR family oxidoreductase [Noviherbaspirillum sp.]HJV84148.1 SDR family oxidoreductase [Noviherbaspirillum sp.]
MSITMLSVAAGAGAAKAESAVNTVRAEGGKADGYVVNVAARATVDAMMTAVKDRHGRIDILVNSAGITRDARLIKMKEAEFDAVIDVNLKGVFNCTQSVVETMLAQGSGAIVNTSSIAGIYGNFGQGNYAASKAGVVGMTKAWARELGPKNIRVNAVAPGATASQMLESVPEEVLKQIREASWLRRIGKPEEIASVYAFLASDEASYINGTLVEVSGGVSV